jgi:ATP-dependent Clp protease protease subunit
MKKLDKKTKKTKKAKEIEEELPEQKTEEEQEAEEAEEFANSLASVLFQTSEAPPEKEKLRTIGLFGEINEENTGDAIASLLTLRQHGKKEELSDPENPESELITRYEPMEIWISTWGGVATDMFALYDAMRIVREDCDISTVGMGKVMSAGVLILAAGTKGKRKIGENCRIMIHSVISGHHGAIHNLENEMEEVRWIQDQHIKCLVKETHMTEKHLRKLLERKVNIYLTAKEAVELGIADEVI